METLKQRREKLIEDKVDVKLPNLIKETEEYLIRYGGHRRVSFERGNEEEQLLRKKFISHFSSVEDVYMKEDWSIAGVDSEIYQDDVILSLEEFGNEHEKGCWIFFMMVVVFIIICVLLMFLTRG